MTTLKVLSAPILLVICILPAIQAYTPQQYANDIWNGHDRQYSPVTKDMCENNARLRQLKMCRFLAQDKDKVEDESDEVFTYDMNYWKRVEPAEDTVYNTLSVMATIEQQLDSNLLRSVAFGRKRRAASNESQEAEASVDTPRHRSKRGIDPCASSTASRAVALHAIDARRGTIVEIFHNPDRKLYQMFFMQTCTGLYSYWPTLRCEQRYVDAIMPVFKPDTDSLEITVMPVKIPFGCAAVFR